MHSYRDLRPWTLGVSHHTMLERLVHQKKKKKMLERLSKASFYCYIQISQNLLTTKRTLACACLHGQLSYNCSALADTLALLYLKILLPFSAYISFPGRPSRTPSCTRTSTGPHPLAARQFRSSRHAYPVRTRSGPPPTFKINEVVTIIKSRIVLP